MPGYELTYAADQDFESQGIVIMRHLISYLFPVEPDS